MGDLDHTVDVLQKGDHRVLSRLISLLERGDPEAAGVMERIYPSTGQAYCIGITGPPGVGKSTIADGLTRILRGRGVGVGVIAVDPTSPYSGGALLGDRVRMGRHYLDPGVFIRSIATRGSSGGLPRVIKGVVRLLDAAAKEVVLLETVGAGQTELAVMEVADTVVVTLVPESGDAIQALKAGLMEIADIYVVNKADLPGADRMIQEIDSMVKMIPSNTEWVPNVLATQAGKGEGIDQLYQAITAHRQYLEESSLLEQRRTDRRAAEFLATVEEELGRRLREMVHQDPRLNSALLSVKRGESEPYSSALRLLKEDPSLVSRLLPSSSSSG